MGSRLLSWSRWGYAPNRAEKEKGVAVMEVTDKKASITGKVVFLRGKEEPPYCVCCGDPNTPHKHVFGHRIELDEHPKCTAIGLRIESVYDFINETMHIIPNIEGKGVRVSVEVLDNK